MIGSKLLGLKTSKVNKNKYCNYRDNFHTLQIKIFLSKQFYESFTRKQNKYWKL